MHIAQLALTLLAGGAAAVPTSFGSRYAVKERHIVPRGWSAQGPAPKTYPLNIKIGLTQNNQDVLEQHVNEISDPSHPRYGQHLSASEVNDLIAPSEDTVRLVLDWLKDHSITDGKLSPAKDWIEVTLPVERVEKLLDTSYSIFTHSDGSSMVRAPEWSLPEHLHEHIDVVQPTTSFFRGKRQSTDFVPSGNGGGWHSIDWWHKHHPKPYTPPGSPANLSAICNITFTTLECLRNLYQTIDYVPQVPEKNAIAVTNYLGETQNRSDLHLYLENFRPEAAHVAYEFPITVVDNGLNVQTYNATYIADGSGVEGDLDGELAVGISYPTQFSSWVTGGEPPFNPDLNTPTDTNEPYITWLTYVLAQDNLPQVISTSYGDDEQTVPYSYARRACDGFKQLGARGISVFFSSGDAGVGANGTCISNIDNTTARFIPAFPTSCPWVTSVGGTQAFEPEVAVSRFGSGAGFSNYFSRPAYQNSAVEGYLAKIGDLYDGLYNRSGRAYPDVAAQGNHDVIVWAERVRTVGGTSASSPAFAAVIALVNDALIAEGKPPLGFMNPWLYAGGYRALNDILSGSSIGCNSSGFPAEVGWDAVTGFGTPNFPKLKAAALASARGHGHY